MELSSIIRIDFHVLGNVTLFCNGNLYKRINGPPLPTNHEGGYFINIGLLSLPPIIQSNGHNFYPVDKNGNHYSSSFEVEMMLKYHHQLQEKKQKNQISSSREERRKKKQEQQQDLQQFQLLQQQHWFQQKQLFQQQNLESQEQWEIQQNYKQQRELQLQQQQQELQLQQQQEEQKQQQKDKQSPLSKFQNHQKIGEFDEKKIIQQQEKEEQQQEENGQVQELQSNERQGNQKTEKEQNYHGGQLYFEEHAHEKTNYCYHVKKKEGQEQEPDQTQPHRQKTPQQRRGGQRTRVQSRIRKEKSKLQKEEEKGEKQQQRPDNEKRHKETKDSQEKQQEKKDEEEKKPYSFISAKKANGKLHDCALIVFKKAYGFDCARIPHTELVAEVMQKTGCSKNAIESLLYRKVYDAILKPLRDKIPNYYDEMEVRNVNSDFDFTQLSFYDFDSNQYR